MCWVLVDLTITWLSFDPSVVDSDRKGRERKREGERE